MKNLKKLTILLFAALLTISCSSDDNDPTAGSNNGSSITAKVDGQDFASIELATTAVITNGVLALQGSDASGNFIRINILSYNGTGTYVSGDALTNSNLMMYGTATNATGWVTTMNVGSGTLNVTSDDGTTIEGTFSFMAEPGNTSSTGTKNVTNGDFKVAIQ